jgi:hypothetical protein
VQLLIIASPYSYNLDVLFRNIVPVLVLLAAVSAYVKFVSAGALGGQEDAASHLVALGDVLGVSLTVSELPSGE